MDPDISIIEGQIEDDLLAQTKFHRSNEITQNNNETLKLLAHQYLVHTNERNKHFRKKTLTL